MIDLEKLPIIKSDRWKLKVLYYLSTVERATIHEINLHYDTKRNDASKNAIKFLALGGFVTSVTERRYLQEVTHYSIEKAGFHLLEAYGIIERTST